MAEHNSKGQRWPSLHDTGAWMALVPHRMCALAWQGKDELLPRPYAELTRHCIALLPALAAAVEGDVAPLADAAGH